MMYVGGCLELGEEGVDEERLVQLVVVRVVLLYPALCPTLPYTLSYPT